MALELRDYQETMYEDARELRRQGIKSILFQSPTGSGKCLGLGTPVLKYDGTIVRVEDIRVGDLLMGPDSKPRVVRSLARGRETMYRVTPTKGDSYVCNESHILSLKITGGNGLGYRKNETVNMSVYGFMKQSKTFKHCAKGWRSAVDFPLHTDPILINPYMLGVWLGDGNSRQFSITSGDPEIVKEVEAYAGSLGMRIRHEDNSENSINLHVVNDDGLRGDNASALINALDFYKLRRNKHIPHRYKTGSREERFEVMAGILDTDGSFDKCQYDLTLKSKRLIDDFVFIARSLGFSAYPHSVMKECANNGKIGTYWRCSINGPIEKIPCRILRKQAGPRKQIKNVLLTGIGITKLDEDDYYGFEISGDGLFLLGDFTVTHNTVLAAKLLKTCVDKGFTAWFLCHRREILDQSLVKLHDADVPAGIVASGLPMNAMAPVQVCSIQTLRNRHFKLPRPNLIVYDECHHLASSTWAAIYACYPDAVHIGLSATPQRLDGAGLGKFFQRMLIGPSTATLIKEGWLSPYRFFAPGHVNLDGVEIVAGDYNKKQLEVAMSQSSVVGDAVAHYTKHVPGKRAIIFMYSIDSSIEMAARFNRLGIPAAHIDGGTDDRTRRRSIEMFRENRISVLTNVDIVSEGFDLPACEAGFFLRPTQSLTLHLQQIGRCLRPGEGKVAWLFDHAGNCRNLGLPDDERDWTLDGQKKKKKKKKDAEELVRVCPECDEAYPMSVRVCRCGYVLVQAREVDVDESSELSEIDADAIRRARMKEQSKAKDFESLCDFARSKGYKHPTLWARHVLKAREEKEAAYKARRAITPSPETEDQWLF